MNNRRPIREPILLFCGVALVLWVTWQFFQFVQICSVGDSPPHFVAFTKRYNYRPYLDGSLKSRAHTTTYFRTQYSDKLHVTVSPKPIVFPRVAALCIYESAKPANSKVVIVSNNSRLQIRVEPQENYQFADGGYGEYALGWSRYIVGKIYVSGPYIAASVASFDIYAGIRQSKIWLILWKRGQKQPIYHCPIHGELQAFALTK